MGKELLQQPQHINFTYETFGNVLPDQLLQAKTAFNHVGAVLEKEWGVAMPMNIGVSVQDDAFFRARATAGPRSWKYCFLLRNHPKNNVILNTSVFDVLSTDAQKMIKHETAHIVIAQLVGELPTYGKSYFLEEGTAGLDGATDRLIAKLRAQNIHNFPSPATLKTMQDVKAMGGDTNVEPFTHQLGYLLLFSTVEFLRNRHGEGKIIKIYKRLSTNLLEEAYKAVCGEEINDTINDWNSKIKHLSQ